MNTSSLEQGQQSYKHALISERPLNEPRPLKVIYTGAGISGICAALQFPEHVSNLDLVIYEKNPEIGGTWYENRYPGCACDIPAHTYQLSSASSLQWKSFYATAPEILEYWKQIATSCDAYRFIRFKHKCLNARWNDETSKWHVQILNLVTGESFEDIGDVFISSMGVLNEWKWPDIKGLERFKGSIVQIGMPNKTVAVIGSGSSGIQIVPSLLPDVKAIDHYVRGKTWVATPIGSDLKFERETRKRLEAKPELVDVLLPDYPPYCKRLTPEPGYLEALTAPTVDVISTAISHIDETGITTAEGKHRAVDAIVCATGFNTSVAGHIPIYGRNNVNFQDRYSNLPETYLSVSTYDFPNFFQSIGPNGFPGHGNLLIIIEQVHRYITQILQKLSTGNIKTVTPKRSAVQNFTRFCDAYFDRTAFSAKCNTWFKASPPGMSLEDRKKAPITVLWPASSSHAVLALKHVRWEDFDLESMDGNEFGWFGNGWTVADKLDDVDGLSWYLDSTKIIDSPNGALAREGFGETTPKVTSFSRYLKWLYGSIASKV